MNNNFNTYVEELAIKLKSVPNSCFYGLISGKSFKINIYYNSFNLTHYELLKSLISFIYKDIEINNYNLIYMFIKNRSKEELKEVILKSYFDFDLDVSRVFFCPSLLHFFK